MKDSIFTVLVVLAIFFFGYFAGSINLHETIFGFFKGEEAPVMSSVPDDQTQTRSEEHSQDISEPIKFYEKPFQTWVKPIKRTEQKASNDFVNETAKHDLIRSADVTKDEARFFTYNQSDSTVSEFVFESPGRSFSIVTTSDGLLIKKKRWYWRTLMASVSYEAPVDSIPEFQWKRMKAGLETSIEFDDRVILDVGIHHNFNNKLSLNNLVLGLNLKGVIIK